MSNPSFPCPVLPAVASETEIRGATGRPALWGRGGRSGRWMAWAGACLMAAGTAAGDEGFPGPTITVQPIGLEAGVGEPVQLRVGAAGTGFLRFLWFLDGNPLEDETGSQLSYSAIREDRFGVYTVVVSDALGSVESEPAPVVRVDSDFPAWVRQPSGVVAVLGGSARFEAEATGGEPIRYRWRLNGNDLPGATNAVLEIPSVGVTDGGRYTVLVSTPRGMVESRPVTLEIDVPALDFADAFAERGTVGTATGVGRSTNAGATFEAASGEPRHAGKRGGRSMWLTWRAPRDGVAAFATTGSSFDTLLAVYTGDSLGTLMPLAADDDSGNHLTSAVEFNAVAGTDYAIAVDGFAGAEGVIVLSWDLDVGAPPVPRIVAAPEPAVAVEGSDLNLTVTAEGEGLTYQWLFNGQPLPDGSGPLFLASDVTTARAGQYSVRVSNAAGQSVESPGVLVEIVSGPSAPARDKMEDLFDDPLLANGGLHGPGGGGFTSVAPGLPGWRETTNEGATRSPEDPTVYGEVGGASMWFRFRATATGWMRLSTEGSSIPAVLGVYTNRFAPQSVSEGRPRPPRLHAEIVFGALEGEDYLVMLDGVEGARGPVRLSYSLDLAVVTPPVLGLSPAGFSIELAVPPGMYEIAIGDGPDRTTSVVNTNVTGGVLRYLDAAAGDRIRRFYLIRGIR